MIRADVHYMVVMEHIIQVGNALVSNAALAMHVSCGVLPISNYSLSNRATDWRLLLTHVIVDVPLFMPMRIRHTCRRQRQTMALP